MLLEQLVQWIQDILTLVIGEGRGNGCFALAVTVTSPQGSEGMVGHSGAILVHPKHSIPHV